MFCLVNSRNQVDQIVDHLRTAGFSNKDISALFPNQDTAGGFAHQKSTKQRREQAPGAWWAARRAGFGSIGALDIPGVGRFIAAGPIIFALGGAGIGAAVSVITGALTGMGASEFEAKRYQSKIKDGNILIWVHTGNCEEVTRVSEIFTKSDAQDICTTGEPPSPQDTPASEHVSRSCEAAYSHARP